MSMKNRIRLFGTITKMEDLEDGTIIVKGIASSEVVDSQGEVVTAKAMEAAIPDYMKFGAIREMHQPMAAGTALKCEVNAAGETELEAHIVDPVAVLKCRENVYKGFSIGGKVKGRDEVNKNTINALRLTEISLVDVPANPSATFAIGKAEEAEDIISKWAGEEISDARCALQCLDDCFYLLMKESSEMGEPPEQVEALKAVVANLKAFIASEVMEDNANPTQDVFAMSDVAGDLSKAGVELPAEQLEKFQAWWQGIAKKGKKFSKSTTDKLSALHKTIKDADEHLNKLGYEPEDGTKDEPKGQKKPKDDAKDEEPIGDKGKAGEIEDLKKANVDTIAKAAALEEELSKVTSENAELKKSIEAFKALPAAPKGSVMAVAKGADLGTGGEARKEVEPIRKGDGSVDDVATSIKAIHRGAPVQ